ncbi:uncharacterized protein EI97DRAFT_432625 [Westerdykella ornata]|uniref:Uncharacterized protein n=1 Tax=Westerdykella ornata TaxID=318751 RepID=A0A6A6JKK6_WESOR|nr:uncharacterized protein EI97DRAFT_432625 [Westerdykella ornata]KAF2277012.1 hypothetical protein EI97DRAFT_432625 [Westerdykella ornata]
MSAGTVFIFKFVGTVSVGLLTGLSATLSAVSLPALLSLPTALTARQTLTDLSTRSRVFSTYLRHITTFSLFSAYLLSPRRFRHPYLLYVSLFTAASGPGVDYAFSTVGSEERHGRVLGEVKEGEQRDLEAGPEEVNGEEVGKGLQSMKAREGVRAIVAGIGFAMSVVGIWGDGA